MKIGSLSFLGALAAITLVSAALVLAAPIPKPVPVAQKKKTYKWVPTFGGKGGVEFSAKEFQIGISGLSVPAGSRLIVVSSESEITPGSHRQRHTNTRLPTFPQA